MNRAVGVVTVAALWLFLAGAVWAVSPTGATPDSQKRHITTDDSLSLYAWYTPSPDKKAPLILLLPMMAHTHESYDPFILAIREYRDADTSRAEQLMPHLLSFDLRGHGESVVRGLDTLHWRSLDTAGFAKFPADVKAMVDALLAEHGETIDSSDITVIGASIGANVAIMLSAIMPGVSTVVMLSPGENYHGMRPAEAAKAFRGKGYIFAATEDKYTAESSMDLMEINQEHFMLYMFRGGDHGSDIINKEPRAMAKLLEWLFPE